MDRPTGIFVDGIGAAAATSGVLTQLQGRIFALLYLHQRPLALEEIAVELEQSKSNISVNIRGLVEWHLVRRTHVAGSRKDHYEAATDFWRVMQEIMERRFRWNLRQVLPPPRRRGRRAHGDLASVPFCKSSRTSKSCGWRSTNATPEHGAHLPALANPRAHPRLPARG